MPERLLKLLDALDRQSLRYCALRDGPCLERFTAGGELDLLVEECRAAEFAEMAIGLGFVRVPAWGRAPHRFFLGPVEGSPSGLKLDVVTRLAFGRRSKALVTGLAPGCLDTRRRCGPVFVPSPEYEFVTLLLHCVLDKGRFAPERRERLAELCVQVGDWARVGGLLDAYWLPGTTGERIVSRLRDEDWGGLLAEGRQVAARLAGRDPLGTAARRLRDRALRTLDRWAGFCRPASRIACPAAVALRTDGRARR